MRRQDNVGCGSFEGRRSGGEVALFAFKLDTPDLDAPAVRRPCMAQSASVKPDAPYLQRISLIINVFHPQPICRLFLSKH